jgi:hypothetical protein
MKTFDPFIELFLFFLELKTKRRKNGQSVLSPIVPRSAGGNQNFTFLYPMTFLYHIRWKVWYPEYLEIVSDEI